MSTTAPAFAPESCNGQWIDNAPRRLAFDPGRDFATWRRDLRAALADLLGRMPERVPVNVRREPAQDGPGFRETRFVFTAEPGADVPCHLLVPAGARGPVPVVICLQGHSTGMHISLGRAKSEKDAASIEGDRDFAIQAVREGYAALVMEQRCFGERADARSTGVRHVSSGCHHASMAALLVGRTMIGMRAWDVSRAIDAMLESFGDEVDASRIGLMGNSGGGTVTWYAAATDERIGVAMPSCAVCTFRDSIGSIDHCACNYIPRIMEHVEMGDIAGLIAPRPVVIVTGRDDTIFPLPGVRESFEGIRRIYQKAGAPDRCELIIGPGGHRFYAEQAWPVFRRLSGWA